MARSGMKVVAVMASAPGFRGTQQRAVGWRGLWRRKRHHPHGYTTGQCPLERLLGERLFLFLPGLYCRIDRVQHQHSAGEADKASNQFDSRSRPAQAVCRQPATREASANKKPEFVISESLSH
jgi:hypothetical protein